MAPNVCPRMMHMNHLAQILVGFVLRSLRLEGARERVTSIHGLPRRGLLGNWLSCVGVQRTSRSVCAYPSAGTYVSLADKKVQKGVAPAARRTKTLPRWPRQSATCARGLCRARIITCSRHSRDDRRGAF